MMVVNQGMIHALPHTIRCAPMLEDELLPAWRTTTTRAVTVMDAGHRPGHHPGGGGGHAGTQDGTPVGPRPGHRPRHRRDTGRDTTHRPGHKMGSQQPPASTGQAKRRAGSKRHNCFLVCVRGGVAQASLDRTSSTGPSIADPKLDQLDVRPNTGAQGSDLQAVPHFRHRFRPRGRSRKYRPDPHEWPKSVPKRRNTF